MLINVRLFRALALFPLKSGMRYNMQGIHIVANADAIEMTASDGATLLAVRQEWEKDDFRFEWSAIFPTVYVRQIEAKKGYFDLRPGPDRNRATIKNGDAELSVPMIVAAFPEWRSRIPSETSGEPSAINPEYYRRFQLAAEIVNRKFENIPSLHQNGDDPCLVGMPEIRSARWFGLLMPRRKDRNDVLDVWCREQSS